MAAPGRNGMRTDHDLDDDHILTEDDVVEIVDLEPNDDGDMDAEMDMLDMNEADDEDDGDDGYNDVAMMAKPERDDAKLVFNKHTGSVFSVSVVEDGDLIVTGGEDDMAYVWRLDTGQVIMECTGHRDSVTCVAAHTNNTYIATGDLAGLLQVWDVKEKKLVWSFEVSDLEWLCWHPVVPVLLAGTVDGDMWMWKIPDGDTKTFSSTAHTCNIGKVTPDGKRCISGYADGSVRVWDLKTAASIHTLSGYTGHSNSITSMCCHGNNNLVITGSTDCTALLFNETTGKVAARFQCKSSSGGSDGEKEDSVEAVGLSNVQPFAATGTLSGHLTLWDIPTQICRQQCKHDAGIVRLEWHASEPLLYTCTLDGIVALYDARTGNRERAWTGHEAPILDMYVVKDGSKVVTTSDDHTARLFTL